MKKLAALLLAIFGAGSAQATVYVGPRALSMGPSPKALAGEDYLPLLRSPGVSDITRRLEPAARPAFVRLRVYRSWRQDSSPCQQQLLPAAKFSAEPLAVSGGEAYLSLPTWLLPTLAVMGELSDEALVDHFSVLSHRLRQLEKAGFSFGRDWHWRDVRRLPVPRGLQEALISFMDSGGKIRLGGPSQLSAVFDNDRALSALPVWARNEGLYWGGSRRIEIYPASVAFNAHLHEQKQLIHRFEKALRHELAHAALEEAGFDKARILAWTLKHRPDIQNVLHRGAQGLRAPHTFFWWDAAASLKAFGSCGACVGEFSQSFQLLTGYPVSSRGQKLFQRLLPWAVAQWPLIETAGFAGLPSPMDEAFDELLDFEFAVAPEGQSRAWSAKQSLALAGVVQAWLSERIAYDFDGDPMPEAMYGFRPGMMELLRKDGLSPDAFVRNVQPLVRLRRLLGKERRERDWWTLGLRTGLRD